MKISNIASVIEPSLSRKLYNMSKNYSDVIDLTLGDPDVKTPHAIREAARNAISNGQTRYSANAGLLAFREAVANVLKKEYGQTVDPNTEIIATVGGMEALYLSLACIIDSGDEVIVQAPYYVNYVQMIKMCGGIPVIVNTKKEDGFCLTKTQIDNAISDKTVAIIINTPCNPTGVVMDKDIIDYIADKAISQDFIVISDEVYRSLLFEGKHESVFTRNGMRDRTILIDSLSKRFAMTGYRIGYAVGPEEIIANMTKMQENVAACAPLPSQYAGIVALTECLDDDSVYRVFLERRNFIYDALTKVPKISCMKPQGTFYLFVDISQMGLNSVDFSYKLLEKEHVAVVPGRTYGDEYDNFIRIAYTLEIDKLKTAVERITSFIKNN